MEDGVWVCFNITNAWACSFYLQILNMLVGAPLQSVEVHPPGGGESLRHPGAAPPLTISPLWSPSAGCSSRDGCCRSPVAVPHVSGGEGGGGCWDHSSLNINSMVAHVSILYNRMGLPYCLVLSPPVGSECKIWGTSLFVWQPHYNFNINAN